MPVTPNKGLLYPAPGAFIDAQDSYNLAIGADALERNYINQLLAAATPTAFLYRTTANGPTGSSTQSFFAGTTVADYDNTGTVFANSGSLGWTQNAAEPLSYYLLGYNMQLLITSGTATAGNNIVGQMAVTSTDPLSGLTSTSNFYKSTFETVNGGEQIQGMAVVKIYQGAMFPSISFTNLGGTAVYAVGTGSRSWGLRLGTVPS